MGSSMKWNCHFDKEMSLEDFMIGVEINKCTSGGTTDQHNDRGKRSVGYRDASHL